MTEIRIGYARCSTDRQDLQALAAVRQGDTLVAETGQAGPFSSDARDIADALQARGVTWRWATGTDHRMIR
jgi:hypothetical protein